MAAIIVKSEGSLLNVYVSGILTAEEVTSVIKKHYTNEIIKDIIWDISIGSLGSITEDGYKEIARTANDAISGGSRKGGKTAFVGHDNIECGLLKIYTAIAIETGVPTKYHVFRTIGKARDWISK
ncbi:MAG: hypothetical protein ACOYL3_28055 [Desulfuromonadaceae bacterium]